MQTLQETIERIALFFYIKKNQKLPPLHMLNKNRFVDFEKPTTKFIKNDNSKPRT